MPVLNCYTRSFALQHNLQDTFERVGQTLARPLTVIAGHSYKISNNKMTEVKPHLVEKIILVSLAILTLPISIPLICLGLLLVNLSSSHKNLSHLLQSGKVLLQSDLPTAYFRECFQRQKPLSSLDAFQRYYDLDLSELEFCKARHQSRQSTPISDKDFALCYNKEHAWLSVCEEAYESFGDEKGYLPEDVARNLLALYEQEGLYASTPFAAFELAGLITNLLSFDTSFAEKNGKLIEAVKSTPFRYMPYSRSRGNPMYSLGHSFYRLTMVKFFLEFDLVRAESFIRFYSSQYTSSTSFLELANTLGSYPTVLSVFIKELMNYYWTRNVNSATFPQFKYYIELLTPIKIILEKHLEVIKKISIDPWSNRPLERADDTMNEILEKHMKVILERVANIAPKERDEKGLFVVPEATLNLIANLKQGILGALSYDRRSAAIIAMAFTEEEAS